jgi:3-phosphoshikimate 1-carboxyvinyltransferase
MPTKSFTVCLKSKIKSYKKVITVDSDKSLSIRSFLIGSICQGISMASNVLESDDVKSTINACRILGVKIIKVKHGFFKIYGKGLGSFIAKKNLTINFGNSGTLARLLIGILSTNPNIQINVKGDHSLNKRSMKKLKDLLSKFGAVFLPKHKQKFPLKLISSEMPVGLKYKAGVSAQLKSAAILAGLNSYGNTIIEEHIGSRDHTENLLIKNNQAIKISEKGKRIIKVVGKSYLNPLNLNISGDPSSAAFFTALTLLNDNSTLKIKNVGLNPTRTGFYQILKKQRAKIKFTNLKKVNNEIKGDIYIRSCKLSSIKTESHLYSKTADEFPIFFVIAALIKGTSVFKGIQDLANKESDRIKEMQKVIKQVGVHSSYSKGILKIFGKGMVDASSKNIIVPNLGDHRIAQSSFVLALLTGAKTKINNFETVFTSAPSFLKIMKLIGAKFEVKK